MFSIFNVSTQTAERSNMSQQTTVLNEHMPSTQACKNKTQVISVIRRKKTTKQSKKTLQKIGQAVKYTYKPKMQKSKKIHTLIIV